MAHSIAVAARTTAGGDLRDTLRSYDWREIEADLNRDGYARLPRLLDDFAIRRLRDLYGDRRRFRSFVDMASHRYGAGDYRYFDRPLPAVVRTLRTQLYRRLRPIANRWQERLALDYRYPPHLSGYLAECRAAGQQRPTPLLLRYGAGGFNCLHRDLYGDLAFPLQVAVLLSAPAPGRSARDGRDGRDEFSGGEFLLCEQRPRQQTRAEAIALSRGEGLIFPNHVRPVDGSRGVFRAQMRHGVSRVHAGDRLTLGIIFHDAR